MTLFGLVRHGQTDYNARNLFQGSSDIPLNATGIEQAHRALDHVPDLDWDLVVSSPLQRAEQTARIIGEDHGIPFGGTFADLSEIDWGEAEGRDVAEMEALYPDRSFPGREDHQHVADRGYDALERLADLYPGKRILVVAHGTIIRFLLSGIAEQALDSIPNATLSIVTLEGTTWGVEMIANTAVRNTVRTSSREQNPRFVLAHRHVQPGGDPVAAKDQDPRVQAALDPTGPTEQIR
ncbi:histidine phosphatase family protein [Brachybacterium sp. JHP9]|uniref:Histidine phosphatase family protein n=1 Tax=Brachybacterium equifaecis TaxID=2910770 RepID=A0ABT0R1U4_9MICO|nr:histidine phosphatase family protein [Brachybacterium equifaecis]MCL6423887.1 histidine phosphatase family protein [Brachybacterium equifaecis]